MNKLVKFYWDCGRMGRVEGIFVANQDELDFIVGKRVDFGEILGKHSEVHGVIAAEDLKVLSEDQDFINKCLDIFGKVTISGYNPILYYGYNHE